MEEKDNKKQKTGCGKALIIFIIVYALLCLVYVGLRKDTQESIDSFVSFLGVLFVIVLLIAGFMARK